jgi:hypothetical protein
MQPLQTSGRLHCQSRFSHSPASDSRVRRFDAQFLAIGPVAAASCRRKTNRRNERPLGREAPHFRLVNRSSLARNEPQSPPRLGTCGLGKACRRRASFRRTAALFPLAAMEGVELHQKSGRRNISAAIDLLVPARIKGAMASGPCLMVTNPTFLSVTCPAFPRCCHV